LEFLSELKKNILPNNGHTRIFLASVVTSVIISVICVINEFIDYKKYFIRGYNQKIHSIDNTIHSEIIDAKHILYGLALSISQESMMDKPKKITSLLRNFDPRLTPDEENSVPFASISVSNKDGMIVANSIIGLNYFMHNNINDNSNYRECMQELGNDFFKIRVSPVRIGSFIKEPMIPLNIRISDINNNFYGAICSGIIVRELNAQLKFRYAYARHIQGVRIISNIEEVKESMNPIPTWNILTSLLLNKMIFVVFKSNKYPFYIEAAFSQSHTREAFVRYLISHLMIIMVQIIMAFLITINFKSSYEKPLLGTVRKLAALREGGNIDHKIQDRSDEIIIIDVAPFSPDQFAKDVNDLIKNYLALNQHSSSLIKQSKIQKKIMDLIFIEQHYLALQKSKISEHKLYLSKLISIVDEEPITSSLEEFMSLVSNYCSQFYHEIEIKLIIEKKDKRKFSFKQSALIETIFSIFTFIMRSSLDTDKANFVLKATFINQNNFPTITLEADIGANNTSGLGWELGPNYVNTSLLSIYLSAKKNKLFFNINKKGNKIIFTLDPIYQKMEFYNLAFL